VNEYKRKPNTFCDICKNPIYKRPSQIEKNNGHVFCSTKCYGISCRKEIHCFVCNKLILAGLNKKTCSRECANKKRTGIKYKIGRPKDKVKSFRILKLKMMKKRGEKCERCNYNKREILQVHHKDRNRNNNSFSNLELICPNCHSEEHLLKKSWLRNSIEKEEEKDILK